MQYIIHHALAAWLLFFPILGARGKAPAKQINNKAKHVQLKMIIEIRDSLPLTVTGHCLEVLTRIYGQYQDVKNIIITSSD